ncbi:MAG: HAD-IA family hydrolase, partial [Gammaproteobacteria bacterium]
RKERGQVMDPADEAESQGHRVNGKDVLDLLSGDVRPEMVAALKRIKQSQKVGCITNNVNTGQGPGMAKSSRKASEVADIMAEFDVVMESSKIGIRKPDPRIYQMTCEHMSITPEETIDLDDLGINLKPARALGMTTIKVLSAEQALTELEQHLGYALR